MGEWMIDKYDFITKEETLFPSEGMIIKYDDFNKILEMPKTGRIKVLGLRQDTFEYFIDRYGELFESIYFFKCPLIGDFSKLASCKRLKHLQVFWNQRAERLWCMKDNVNLKALSIDDFSRLHDLNDVTTAPNLEEFHFGDMIWPGFILDSLEPLARCENLRYLSFSAKKIINNDITPLASLEKLEELVFFDKLFTTEQIAWLTAKLPHVKSGQLAPYWMHRPIESHTATVIKHLDTRICGKRKPLLDSNLDKVRIDKYVEQFNKLVNQYKSE